MAKDPKPPEKPARFEETQQIRVRAKNPQIGRKRSDLVVEDATVQADSEDLLRTERPRVVPQPVLVPIPAFEPMDDDATEILMGPSPLAAGGPVLGRRPAPPSVVVRDEPGASIMRSTVPQQPRPRERAETALDRGPTRRLATDDEAPTTRPARGERGREAERSREAERTRDAERSRDQPASEARTTRPARREEDDDRRPTPRDPIRMDRDPIRIERDPARVERDNARAERTPAPHEDPPTERPTPRNARPRGRMEPLGTEGAGILAQKAKIARAEGHMAPQARHPALKPYRGILDDRALSALDRVLAGELDARDVEPSSSPKRALERVVFSDALERLTLDERAAILRALAAQPRELETMRAAARILERAPWQRLSAHERSSIAELLGLLRPAQAMLLADVVERSLHGKSAIEDRDLADTTVVAQLLGLARERAVAARIENAGLDHATALELVLTAIAHPASLPLDEGADGVLGGIELGLADATPAEYVRLWRSLTTGDSNAALAGDGSIDLADTLRSRPGTTFRGRESPLRVGLETLVGLAHPRTGPNRSGLLMPGGHGIDADVTARVLGHLYGVGFTVAAGATAATRHLDRLRPDAQRVPPAFITLLYDGGERMFVFDHIADERAFVRAPHGDSTKPRGGRRPDPLRLIEAPERGLESVSMAELQQIVGVALVPRT